MVIATLSEFMPLSDLHVLTRQRVYNMQKQSRTGGSPFINSIFFYKSRKNTFIFLSVGIITVIFTLTF